MNKDKLIMLQSDDTMVARAEAVDTLIRTIPGESADRPGLVQTPWRVAKMYDEIFWGYKADAEEVLRDAMFDDIPSDDLVLVKDIQFYSMCEHHMMPFFGKVHIAYIPKEGNVVGISKLARIVEIYARRLQVQERLGHQIADVIQKVMDPLGVAVIISGEHTCMTMRGIQKPGTQTVTSCLKGVFKLDGKAREELYNALKL